MKFYLRKINDVTYIRDSGEDSIKVGEVVSCEIKRPRNYKFHKKFFSLLNYAFSIWEPETVNLDNTPVGKNFDHFRDNITILAGYYEAVMGVDGEAHLKAKSISFGKMGEDEFASLYSKTIDVILKHILVNYTREDLDRVFENIIAYD